METNFIVLVFLLLVCQAVLAAKQPQLNVDIRNDHLYEHNGIRYIRFYQTVYSATPGISWEIFLPNAKPNERLYKDIAMDTEGRVIIFPGMANTTSGTLTNYNWFGIGDFRRQLLMMDSYKSQGAREPLIRSFLVKYDSVRKLLLRVTNEANKRFVTEDYVLNVDKYLPNQFGLTLKHVNEISKNILSYSLVTYKENPVQNRPGWGKVLLLRELEVLSQHIPQINNMGEGKVHDLPVNYFPGQLQGIRNDHMFTNVPENEINEMMQNYEAISNIHKRVLEIVDNFLKRIDKLKNSIHNDECIETDIFEKWDLTLKSVFEKNPFFVQKLRCGNVLGFDKFDINKYLIKIKKTLDSTKIKKMLMQKKIEREKSGKQNVRNNENLRNKKGCD